MYEDSTMIVRDALNGIERVWNYGVDRRCYGYVYQYVYVYG